jgi:hypothetical protein
MNVKIKSKGRYWLMDKVEIMLIKSLIIDEIDRLEKSQAKDDLLNYMQKQELINRYKEILNKLL